MSRLSKVVFGIDLNKIDFLQINDLYKLKPVSSKFAFAWVKKYPKIALDTTDPKIIAQHLSHEKMKYYDEVCDCFAIVFSNNGTEEIAGLFVSNLSDWDSYYFRYIGILPQHRGNHLQVMIMQRLHEFLGKYGIQKIRAHVKPENFTSLKNSARAGLKKIGITNTPTGPLIEIANYPESIQPKGVKHEKEIC